MVEKVRCDHCGAECKRPVVKVIAGRSLNFCCAGCLQVYEMLHEEGALPAPAPAPARAPAGPTQSAQLAIVGMSCANCAARVETGLRAVAGVATATVDLRRERAAVQFDPQQTNLKQLADAVRAAGYDVAAG